MSLGTDEGELAYRTALLQAQMEASIDGLLVVDPGARMTAFNQRFAEIWGMPDDVMASGSDDAALLEDASHEVQGAHSAASALHEHLIKPGPIDRLLTVIEGAAEETT